MHVAKLPTWSRSDFVTVNRYYCLLPIIISPPGTYVHMYFVTFSSTHKFATPMCRVEPTFRYRLLNPVAFNRNKLMHGRYLVHNHGIGQWDWRKYCTVVNNSVMLTWLVSCIANSSVTKAGHTRATTTQTYRLKSYSSNWKTSKLNFSKWDSFLIIE